MSDSPTSRDGRIRIGIVGATGYTGSELLRLLAGHPHADVVTITSRAEAGRPVAELFTQLRGHYNLTFTAPDTQALGDCDLVFFATPSGTAMQSTPQLLEQGARVIDLAADFRLKDPALWASWYGMSHQCPDLLEEAVYGLPELHRAAISQARLVANPGCHATAVILGYWPLINADAVDPQSLIADSKSGVSGAGRKAQTGMLMAEVGESFKAYATTGHRHAPEIVQELGRPAGAPLGLTFVPHLLPMVRGIETTLYARPRDPAAEIDPLYAEAYRDEPFVDLMPGGHPDTRSVRGTNLCRIAVGRQGDMLVVQSVIDNLVKGAAGQAVQNMNIMFGLPETMGLDAVALLP